MFPSIVRLQRFRSRDYSRNNPSKNCLSSSISSGSRCLSRQRCSSSHNNSVCHASYPLYIYIVVLPDTTRVNKYKRLETDPFFLRKCHSLFIYIYIYIDRKNKPSRLIESPDRCTWCVLNCTVVATRCVILNSETDRRVISRRLDRWRWYAQRGSKDWPGRVIE